MRGSSWGSVYWIVSVAILIDIDALVIALCRFYFFEVRKLTLLLLFFQISNMIFILTEKCNSLCCQTKTRRRNLRGAGLCRVCCCPPFLMMSYESRG